MVFLWTILIFATRGMILAAQPDASCATSEHDVAVGGQLYLHTDADVEVEVDVMSLLQFPIKIHSRQGYASSSMPEDCIGASTKEDLMRPIKEVLKEHGNPDGYCYFQNSVFYVTPSTDQNYTRRGQSGVEALMNWDVTCKQPYREHQGPAVTWYGDWGNVSTDHLDCQFYVQDLIYCYTFGWLRNQHLDSSLITNHTAWIELAATECEQLQERFQFHDDEVTVGRMMHENEITGNIGKTATCSLSPTCKTPITSRELAAHVYPKCLMSLEHGAANEMAYCQAIGCVMPNNKIGTGSQCE